jgi:uncharacterized protein
MAVVVDFRVRPPYKGFLDTFHYRPRPISRDPATMSGFHIDLEPSRSVTDRSMTAFIDEFDAAGIDLGVIMGRQAPPAFGSIPNEDVAELVAAYPKRFVGFGSVNGSQTARALDDIDRIVDLGLRGVAMDNGYWALHDDDASLYPIYEKIAKTGLILSLTSSIFIGDDMTYCMPVHIQRVARRYPQLKIVVPHGGWPWTTEMCAVAFQCTNVHLVPDFYMHIPNMPGAEQYLRSANYFLSYRLLYASSYPIRPLGQSLRQFKALAFASSDIRDRCLGANALRVLELPA